MPKSFKTVEIMQDCAHGYTREVCQKVLDGWSVVKDYAWIVHDKDEKSDGTPKRAHIHCMIRFTGSVPTDAILARVKAVTGRDDVIKYEHLGKCYAWKKAVAYLTHEISPEKYLYSRDEVVSNYDFVEDIEKALTDKIRCEKLLDGIAKGEIKEYNIYDFCTVVEYANWQSKIKNAFEYRTKMLINQGDRDMKCIYIQGDSGTGKTTYAKQLCAQHEWSFFVSSGSNDVLDGYGGQDCVILDDLRPSCLNLSDLLKMLDNNTSSTVKSRFKNKAIQCRAIIITTTLDIDTFFKNVFSEQPETAKQLRRRCTMLVKMFPETAEIYAYIPPLDDYQKAVTIPNPVAAQYGMTVERAKDIMADTLLDMIGQMDGVKEQLQEWKTKKNDGFVEVDGKELPWQ